jgi:hypothetical protein
VLRKELSGYTNSEMTRLGVIRYKECKQQPERRVKTCSNKSGPEGIEWSTFRTHKDDPACVYEYLELMDVLYDDSDSRILDTIPRALLDNWRKWDGVFLAESSSPLACVSCIKPIQQTSHSRNICCHYAGDKIQRGTKKRPSGRVLRLSIVMYNIRIRYAIAERERADRSRIMLAKFTRFRFPNRKVRRESETLATIPEETEADMAEEENSIAYNWTVPKLPCVQRTLLTTARKRL